MKIIYAVNITMYNDNYDYFCTKEKIYFVNEILRLIESKENIYILLIEAYSALRLSIMSIK